MWTPASGSAPPRDPATPSPRDSATPPSHDAVAPASCSRSPSVAGRTPPATRAATSGAGRTALGGTQTALGGTLISWASGVALGSRTEKKLCIKIQLNTHTHTHTHHTHTYTESDRHTLCAQCQSKANGHAQRWSWVPRPGCPHSQSTHRTSQKSYTLARRILIFQTSKACYKTRSTRAHAGECVCVCVCVCDVR